MSALDFYRQQYPDVFGGMNDYQALQELSRGSGKSVDEVATKLGIDAPSLLGEVKKGVSRGIDQLQGTAYAGAGWLGDVAGVDSVRDWGLAGMRRNAQEAAQQGAAVGDYREVGGLRDALMYGAGAVGEALPQFAPGLGAGAIGARMVASAAAKKATVAGLELAAKKKLVGDAIQRGALQGGAAYGIASETANNYGDIYEKTGEYAPGTALAYGAPGGLVEGLSERLLFKNVAKGMPKGMSRSRYAAQEAGKQFLTEGMLEELPQTLLSQAAVNAVDPTVGYDEHELINAALKGGIGGGVIGAGGAMVTSRQKDGTERDLVGKGIDLLHKGAEALGRKRALDEIAAAEAGAQNPALEADKALRSRFEDLFTERTRHELAAAPDAEMPDEEVSTRYRGLADQEAERILTAQARSLGGNEKELRDAAARYKASGDWAAFRNTLTELDRKQSRSSMMEEFDNGAKFSNMSMDKDELSNLAAVWQANEGKKHSWVFDESDDGKALSAKLFGWIKSGFGKTVNDGEVFMPTRMLDELGDTAPKVVQSAISAARKEGWNIEDAGDIVEKVKSYAMRNSGDVGVLKNTLRYSQEANWNDQLLQRFAKEMRSKKGQMDKEDYKWLRSQFSDPEKVVEHFRSDSSYYKAPNKLKAPDSMKALEAELQGDADITENDGDWNSGVSEIGAKTTRTYPTFETGEFFNLNDESQRQEFEKLSTEHAGRQNGSSVKRVAKVGIVDRTLEKLAEERGTTVEALAPQTRAKVMRDLVHEYFPKFERLGSKPKGVSELTLRDYERRKIEYEKGLQRRVNLLNQKLVALAVEERDFEKLGTQISADDVHMKSADIRKPVFGPHKGTLIFQSLNRTGARKGEASTRPFVTSTQMLLAKMFQAKDSNGASTKEYEGTAQEMLQLLSDGVSSVLQDPRFGNAEKPAKIGTVVNGQRVWFDTADVRKWPQDLVIFRDKAGRRYTLGEALEQERNQSEAKLTIDFDPDEIDNGRHDYVRPKTTWEMKQEMKALLNPETTKETRAKIVMALRSRDDETIQELWQELRDDGVLNSSETVTSIGSSRGDKAEEGQVGTGTLADYDPARIYRDERGLMRSSSTTLSAQSVVGTSKRVPPKDAAKFEPATRSTPNRAENKELATKREEVRQTFIELLRSGMSTFTGAVKNMSKADLDMFKAAHNEFRQQLSDYPLTIARGYFGGNVDAARMLVSRFKKNATEIEAAIRNRRKEVNRAEKRVERMGVEEPGRGRLSHPRGSEAGVVAQSGRERSTEDRELGAGEQRRDAEAGGVRQNDKVDLAKQDAWVLKLASTPRRDALTAVIKLPYEKLQKAYDALSTFSPANNSNPFWQRNSLDLYTRDMERTVTRAMELIEDRLYDEAQDDGKNPRNDGRVRRASGAERAGSRPIVRTGLRSGTLGANGTRGSEASVGESGQERRGSDEVSKFSKQSATDKPIDPKEAIAYLKQAFGQDFEVEVVEQLGGHAGMWTEHGILLAANAADGTQFHEALHELFSQLRKHGAENVKALIERVATGPVMKRKLEQLLEAHPKAREQLNLPEEAAAFMFQFWNLGLLEVGSETKGLFETIKGFIAKAAKKLLSLVDAQYREEYNAKEREQADAEAALEALDMLLNHGKLANKDTRQAIYDALRKNVEAHDKAMANLGRGVDSFYRSWGKLFVSNEAMLGLYKEHPELKEIADKFHQVHGSAMKNQARDGTLDAYGGFMEAVGSLTNKWMTRMERMLDGYDQKDLELALKYLETGKGNSSDPKIAKLVDDVRKYMGEMYDYMVESDVRRLDPSSEERWVPVERRTDYWTQVWDVESLLGKRDAFIEKLLSHHMSNLKQMADEANKEVAAWQKNNKAKPESPSAQAAVESGNFETITPEAVAESIYSRLINSMGMIDIEENEWSMGITPGAAAVNRRQLDWLDKEAFSEFKSKDMVNIMTTYTRSMIKRGEYQKRFGYGGEVIAKSVDTAWLREMGGQELVDAAEKALPSAIEEWKQAAAEWHKDNPDAPYPEPYPTLRSVGVQSFRSQNGDGKTNEALINAETALRPAINSIRALEGTLGSEISPAMRNFNSWAVSYQNVRLLPFMLFTNLSDVIGITVQGGTLGDAWDAFVEGIRGIRDSWKGERNKGAMMGRAEEWGVVDAGTLLDSLGQAYGSVYMSQGARRFNEKFFRVIGAEGWNRGIRAAAASVGERIILDWAKNGVDMKKAGEKERFERLFGEGADPKRIALSADGSIDTQDHRNRAAINRFVQDSVMTSNAAHRTAWMADPRYATFAHLKNFAYTFHRVMLLGILDQAKKGNLRPTAVAGLGYASIAIAGGALKEMLIPGDEPAWMKGGLNSYLEYGYRQAGLGGVPMMWLDSAMDLDPAKAAGPMWDQIQNTITSPIPGFKLNLSPFDGETEILKDRKVLSELARAVPAGNIAGRWMDDALRD